jgi:alpha-galactosidase
MDLGILTRVDEVWTSDNTDAFDRLRIQEGLSLAYPPQVMMDWVTDVPNINGRTTPLKFRFLVAMQGAFGIGSNLNRWTDQDFDLARQMIAYYKSIRETVQLGNLYRLLSPREGEVTANEYVSRDAKHAVVFAFLHSQQFLYPPPTVYLRGLDPAAVYQVKRIDGKLTDPQETLSGAYLMNHGLNFILEGDFDSTSVALERVK